MLFTRFELNRSALNLIKANSQIISKYYFFLFCCFLISIPACGYFDSNQSIPLALDSNISTTEDNSVIIQLHISASNEIMLEAIIIALPKHGTLTPSDQILSYSYTPKENYFGEDSFTFIVKNGEIESNEATVMITIDPINDAPVISGQPNLYGNINSPYIFTPNILDIDSDTLTLDIENLPSWANFDFQSGTISGSPTELDTGNYEEILIYVSDEESTSALSSFDIEISGIKVVRGPYLQMLSSNSITIRWRTDQDTKSAISWGTSSEDLSRRTNEELTTEHELSIENLTASTSYLYQIGTVNFPFHEISNSYSFTTAPIPGSDKNTTIWIIGDSGTADDNAKAVKDGFLKYRNNKLTDLWLMLGDNAYNSGYDHEYQSAVFDMYPNLLKQIPLWPTLGNHDGHSANSVKLWGPYYEIFTLPTKGEIGGVSSSTEAYYSFDYGNIHFICLNSYGVDRTTNSPMLTWLENNLSQTNQDWIIAYWHHPPYTKSSHDSDVETNLIEMREYALPILENYDVDVVYTGHSHSYERSMLIRNHYDSSDTLNADMIIDNGDGQINSNGSYTKPGTVYVVAGSSGLVSDTGTLNHPTMYTSYALLGSVVLSVTENTLESNFIDINGEILDYFSIEK